MSGRRLVELHCDHRQLSGRCQEIIQLPVQTIHEARVTAEIAGWRTASRLISGSLQRRSTFDYCPAHAGEQENAARLDRILAQS